VLHTFAEKIDKATKKTEKRERGKRGRWYRGGKGETRGERHSTGKDRKLDKSGGVKKVGGKNGSAVQG